MKAFLFKLFLIVGNTLSLNAGRKVAILLSKLIWRFSKKIKHVTQTNINNCFTHLSSNEKERLAKKSIDSTLMNMLELGKLWNKKTTSKDFIINTHGVELFKSALQEKRGLLLAVPHTGNWEVLNLFLADFDGFAFLYKPPSDKKVKDVLVKNRGNSKTKQIQANAKGVRQIMMHLKDKGFIAILPDQRPKNGQGVFTPFYGIQTYTMSLFSRLAIKTKVPVFYAYALRVNNGFDIYFEKSDDSIYQSLEVSVAGLNQHIQQIVDKAPEQYQWTYKRFSIQPEGEPPFYS